MSRHVRHAHIADSAAIAAVIGRAFASFTIPLDPPPSEVDTSDSNNIRAIVSREGSRLAFDDTTGSTTVLLKSAGGIQILLDDAGKSLTLQFNDSTKIVLNAQGVSVTGTTINLN